MQCGFVRIPLQCICLHIVCLVAIREWSVESFGSVASPPIIPYEPEIGYRANPSELALRLPFSVQPY